MSAEPSRVPARVRLPLRQVLQILGPYLRQRVAEQVRSVWLIVLYLVVFQTLVLGLPVFGAAVIATGIVLVVVGLVTLLHGRADARVDAAGRADRHQAAAEVEAADDPALRLRAGRGCHLRRAGGGRAQGRRVQRQGLGRAAAVPDAQPPCRCAGAGHRHRRRRRGGLRHVALPLRLVAQALHLHTRLPLLLGLSAGLPSSPTCSPSPAWPGTAAASPPGR